jgi:hypothetical protein
LQKEGQISKEGINMGEFEDILANFKPQKPIETFDVILKRLKLSKEQFFAKYRDCMTQTHSKGKTLEIKAELSLKNNPKTKESLEFEVEPQELGFSKKAEVLICTKESDVISPNPKVRKLESGYFLFKVTVELSNVAEWKNRFLTWQDGKLWLSDLSFKDMFTVNFGIDKLRDETLTDYQSAFEKRVYLTPQQFAFLQKQRLVEYTISPYGNIEV